MEDTNIEEIVIDGLKCIVSGAYYDALEGRTSWFEVHTVDEIVHEYEEKSGQVATDLIIRLAELAHKYTLEATARGRARRKAIIERS